MILYPQLSKWFYYSIKSKFSNITYSLVNIFLNESRVIFKFEWINFNMLNSHNMCIQLIVNNSYVYDIILL